MNEGLKFNIGADITGLEKGIQDSQKELQNLAQTIKTSTGEPIKAATDNIKKLDAELVKTGKVISDIKAPIVNGANTLNSFGQVARDLPFGFIAIQNNLPGVVDSFGALTKQAGGTLPALKALGASLAGPAGISFAFGAVIAGTTALIQKYGSLGEAFNVILGITKELTAGQKAYNKALFDAAGGAAAEEAKVSILTKTLLNNKKPQDERIAAYSELKKVAPDVVAGIKDENALTAESNLLIQANASARKENVKLKVQEAGINAALTTNETKLAELRQKLTQADQEYVKASANLSKANQQQVITGFASQTQQQSALKDFNNSISVIKELRNQINNIVKEQDGYLSQLDPITIGIAKINEETRQRVDKLKQQDKSEKDVANTLKKGADEAKNFKYELQSLSEFKLSPDQFNVKQNIDKLQELANIVLNVKASEQKRAEALKQLQALDPKLFQGLTTQKSSYEQIKAAIDVLNEGYLLQLDYYNRTAKSEPIADKFAIANKGLVDFNNNLINTIAVYQRETGKLQPIGVPLTLQSKTTPTPAAPVTAPDLPLGISDTLTKFAADTNNAKLALEDFKKQANLSATYNLINDTFFSPLQDLFSNFLSTGKLAFADFGKAVLKAIQQIVAKIIATGIITLLANIFLPGIGAAGAAGGSAASGGLGKALLSGIGSALGFSLGGNISAPQFAGIGGGTLGMSGSVNVVLRGSDLVGSINRTNATISRVG